MEKMPLLILIFYSIPESVILISLGSALWGYDVRKLLRPVLFLGIILALITYVTRMLPFGFNTLVQLPLFVILTAYFLKLNWKKALMVILTGFAVAVFGESLWSIVTKLFTGKTTEFYYQSGVWVRLSYQLLYLGLLALVNFFIIRSQLSFNSVNSLIKSASLEKKINFIYAVVLLQAFLAGSLYGFKVYRNIWETSISFELLEKITAFSLMTIPVMSVFILRRLFRLAEQETAIQAQEAFIDNVKSLFVTIKGQRHDLVNHLQVIHTFLQLGKNEDAAEYVRNLVGEVKEITNLMKTQDPALNALLNAKQVIAEGLNVSLRVSVQADADNIIIKPLDLIKIVGNLLDNAIDAVRNLPPDLRQVNFTIKKGLQGLVFEVSNPAPVIPAQELAKIFENGYSTKGNAEHSGLGLAIVKQLTDKYRGIIGVKSSEADGTTFSVEFPG